MPAGKQGGSIRAALGGCDDYQDYLMKKIALTLVFLLLPVSATGQSFSSGWVAFDRGEYIVAFQEWQPLAEQGDLGSQIFLGFLYETGLGVSQNTAEAFRWHQRASEQVLGVAQSNMAAIDPDGSEVSQDYAEAVRQYRAAAERGDVRAQENLGFMYERGLGVPQDYAEAVRWLRTAAEQGDVSAQANLAVRYKEGLVVVQDFTEAVRWFRAAAEQGDATAQANLGDMYAQGGRVTQDNVTAHMWNNIAAANGFDPAAELRDTLARRMTLAEVTEAQRRARVCVESGYQECLWTAPLTQEDVNRLHWSIERCWNAGPLWSEIRQVAVTTGFEMSPDGRPIPGTIRLIEVQGGNAASQMQAFEAARRAIEECGAEGYALPREHYDQWRFAEITFGRARMAE